jgi:hypothetical protein
VGQRQRNSAAAEFHQARGQGADQIHQPHTQTQSQPSLPHRTTQRKEDQPQIPIIDKGSELSSYRHVIII